MDLITTTEAARRLGVSTALIRRWIMLRRLPAKKIGRDNFLRVTDVEKFRDRPRRGRPKSSREKSLQMMK